MLAGAVLRIAALAATLVAAFAVAGCVEQSDPHAPDIERIARGVPHVTSATADVAGSDGDERSLGITVTTGVTTDDVGAVFSRTADSPFWGGTTQEVDITLPDGSGIAPLFSAADFAAAHRIVARLSAALGAVQYDPSDRVVWAQEHGERQADAARSALPDDAASLAFHLDGLVTIDTGLPGVEYTDLLYDLPGTLVPVGNPGSRSGDGHGIVLNVRQGGTVPSFDVDGGVERIASVAAEASSRGLVASVGDGAVVDAVDEASVHVGDCDVDSVTDADTALAQQVQAHGVRVEPGRCV